MTRATPLLFVFTLSAPFIARSQQTWTLEQCVAKAEQNNLNIRDRALDIELDRLNKRQAVASFIPSLNGFATHGYNWGRVIDPFTNTFATDRVRTNNLGLRADLDLFNGFRNQRNLEQSKVGIAVSEQALEASKVQLRTAVVDNFVSILDLNERIKMAEVQVARSRSQLVDLMVLIDGGVRANAERFDLEAQIAQEEFNETDLQNQLDQAKLALLQLMQVQDIAYVDFNVEGPDITQVDILPDGLTYSQVLDSAKQGFPAYQQAILSERSSALTVKIAESAYYPSLVLSGSVGSGYSGRNTERVGEPVFLDPVQIGQTATGEDVFSLPQPNYMTETKAFGDQLNDNLNRSMSFSLNIPIFNGLQTRTSVAQARIRQVQAQNRIHSTLNQLSTDVQNALALQSASYKRFVAAQTNYEAAEKAYEYASERLAAGVITSLELRVAKANLDQALAQMVNAKYSAVLAKKYIDILQGKPVTL
jgi:outer membrane protein